MPKAWEIIRAGLKIGDTGPLGLYLGCYHDEKVKRHPVTGKEVRVLEYNMESFLEQCVDRYRQLASVGKLREAGTPFFDDRVALAEHRKEVRQGAAKQQVEEQWVRTDANAKAFRMTTSKGPPWSWVQRRITEDAATGEVLEDVPVQGMSETQLQRPLPRPVEKLRTTLIYCKPLDGETTSGGGDAMPAPDMAAAAGNAGQPGKAEMHPYAARVLMKILYGARMARHDLLKAVNDLACRITQWDEVCDRLSH